MIYTKFKNNIIDLLFILKIKNIIYINFIKKILVYNKNILYKLYKKV